MDKEHYFTYAIDWTKHFLFWCSKISQLSLEHMKIKKNTGGRGLLLGEYGAGIIDVMSFGKAESIDLNTASGALVHKGIKL